jgi:hypothetical protein
VVKKALTVGEQRSIVTSGWSGMTGVSGRTDGTRIDIDWRRQGFARTLIYLVDWSLTGETPTRSR